MRIAIVGAGAIGCVLAARLSTRGHEPTLVGRAGQVEAINRAGLTLRESDGPARSYCLRAVQRLDRRPDLVLLTVKTQDVAQACREMLPLAQGVPTVAMQNGVQADHLAADVLGRDAVVGAVVMSAVTYLKPGEVSVQFPGWLILGEPFRRLGPRTRIIADVLRGAAPVYLTPHLARTRWTKLIYNLNNALCAATGLTLPEIARTAEGRLLSVHLMKEGHQVARASGVRLDHGQYGLTPAALRQGPNAALIAVLQAALTQALATLPASAAAAVLAAAGRTRLSRLPVRFSTWQSIARGRPSEIDYLNGEIVRRGRQLGIPTPYNERVVAMVHRVERSGEFCRLDDLFVPLPTAETDAGPPDVAATQGPAAPDVGVAAPVPTVESPR